MKSRIKEQGSAVHIVIIIVLILVILGLLGFVFWQNFINKSEPATQTTQTTVTASTEFSTCESEEDDKATNGVFCSDEYGVKFTVPNQFKGALEHTDNVPIYPISDVEPEPIGTTTSVISAKKSEGQYEYSLTISLFPKIDNMSLGLLGGGQFDISNDKVYTIESGPDDPSFHRAAEYTSVTSESGIKVYRNTFGDVGYMIYQSAIVLADKVVLIDLKASPTVTDGFPTEIPTVDDTEILATMMLLK